MVQVGLIGAGGIAANYMRTLDAMEQVSVRAVCDVDAARAESMASPRGASTYTDHRVMLERECLDAVFICIPPAAHTDQVRLAAEAGMAVFVAKPVALDLDTARTTLDAIERNGVVNAVGYMWRYADITEKAKELLRDRVVTLAVGQVFVNVPRTVWWRQRAVSGGQIVEQVTHIYDLVRYFCGDVTDVSGFGARATIPDVVDFEDVATVALRLATGGVATVTNTCVAPDGRYALELMGRDFRLRLDYGLRLTGAIGKERIDYTGEQEGYAKQIQVFLDAVRSKDTSNIRSDYRDAMKTLSLTLAADKAVAVD